MAVPKKRTSRLKKKIHHRIWKSKTDKIALRAFSLAQSILTGRSKSFYYIITNKKIDEPIKKD
uniref:ribosomal protein L32 n=1 Tax=Trichomanes auriculatum TaxID=381226 RepID=UPI0028D5249A|nr:ribosomal protein L32 [Vandenboschia auriculata]ALO81786.1 ribosomal protein L32 [Vandenboschia auriculata]